MKDDIILIGPVGAGKSTLGKLVAEAKQWPNVSMDAIRDSYYIEIGYDEDNAKRMLVESGFLTLYRYWKPFEAYAVERLLSEHSECVIDFGAGHSVFEDDALFARVQKALEPYRNVVLLLPSADFDESVRILKERRGEIVDNGFDFAEHFVRHHSNHDLAKLVVYTKDKTPEQSRDEILALTA